MDFINGNTEGHINVKLHNPSMQEIRINKGDRFCQGIFLKFAITDDDAAEGERTGGTGSTGV